MPRKTEVGASSRLPLPDPAAIAPGGQPITPTPPGQREAAQSCATPSRALEGKGRATSLQLHKQLEKTEKTPATTVKKWKKIFGKCDEQLKLLHETMHNTLVRAYSSIGLRENTINRIDNDQQSDERLIKLASAYLDHAIEQANKGLSIFDDSKIEGENTVDHITSMLERFDSLPNKDELCKRNAALKNQEDEIKRMFVECRANKIFISFADINWRIKRIFEREYAPMGEEYEALMKKITEWDDPAGVQSDAEKLVAELDKLYETFLMLAARGSESVKEANKLLGDPHLVWEEPEKADVRQCRNCTHFLEAALFLHAAGIAKRKICILASLALHDNREQQGYENLKKWHESICSLLEVEYAAAYALNEKLIQEEKGGHIGSNKLSEDDLALRMQAAKEGPKHFKKIIKALEKQAAEYEALEGILENEKLPSLMKEMAANAAEYIRSRKYAAPMWSDQLRELKDREASFLPPGMQPRSSRQQTFHKTKEGVVVGRINEQGELEGQDETGKTIFTCFKDQDSGNWVRDYGDEPEFALPTQAAEPALPGESASARAKADILIQKARNIVKSCTRFSQRTLAEAEATPDYDEKIRSLHRAFSAKAKAAAKVKDLWAELQEIQGAGLAEEDLFTPLEEHLERLRADKNDLDMQLQQTQLESTIHSRKRRDPTEANFKFLRGHGQVASIVKEFHRQPSRDNTSDLLDRYTISFKKGPQGERYEPWIVHAHYDSGAPGAMPARVHMKRNAEKEWGMNREAYHAPLSEGAFALVKQEAAGEETGGAGSESAVQPVEYMDQPLGPPLKLTSERQTEDC